MIQGTEEMDESAYCGWPRCLVYCFVASRRRLAFHRFSLLWVKQRTGPLLPGPLLCVGLFSEPSFSLSPSPDVILQTLLQGFVELVQSLLDTPGYCIEHSVSISCCERFLISLLAVSSSLRITRTT
jgi:hypothetical protein